MISQLDILDKTESVLNMRMYSIMRGLEIPDGEGFCGCKVESPSLHELELSSRKHRWPKLNKVMVDFFNALIDKATQKEIELLDVLRLPNIEKVREAEIIEDGDEGRPFVYTDAMDKEVKEIFSEWIQELIGTKAAKQVTPQEAVYPHYMLRSFAVGTDQILADAMRELPDWLPESELEKRRVQALLANPFLDIYVQQGGERIKTELAKAWLPTIRKILKEYSAEGMGSMRVGRKLHMAVGEGKAWWFNRIARSEAALAVNASFDASIQAYSIPYERWSAAADCCPICAYFDGQMWKAGEGPRPVSDSHPACACHMAVVYVNRENRPVQQSWEREVPYDKPYSREMLDAMRAGDRRLIEELLRQGL